jgi:hypothetical protein
VSPITGIPGEPKKFQIDQSPPEKKVVLDPWFILGPWLHIEEVFRVCRKALCHVCDPRAILAEDQQVDIRRGHAPKPHRQ